MMMMFTSITFLVFKMSMDGNSIIQFSSMVLILHYYWPKNDPLPILGNPQVKGVVAGQLYDYATPYIWTSEMNGHFPSTRLLTSQSIFHGIKKSSVLGYTDVATVAEGPCQKYVVKYLETGVIDWTDGTVCGEQFPYFGGEIRK
jgi:hypothetical protein